ncbi:hypothetical protein M885DRAFT_515992, partial [Pelagophyceae sp. CCMP2097]
MHLHDSRMLPDMRAPRRASETASRPGCRVPRFSLYRAVLSFPAPFAPRLSGSPAGAAFRRARIVLPGGGARTRRKVGKVGAGGENARAGKGQSAG